MRARWIDIGLSMITPLARWALALTIIVSPSPFFRRRLAANYSDGVPLRGALAHERYPQAASGLVVPWALALSIMPVANHMMIPREQSEAIE
jgi:hypothetical protein